MVKRRDLISADYEAQLRELHDRRAFSDGGNKYAPAIAELAEKVKAKTILDYGAGHANLAPLLRRYEVAQYDPAVEGKDSLPQPADVVVCTDVLEHIEPDRLGAVLDHIWELTLKACFVVVATRPADKRLPDGRNAHLIIDNSGWWLSQFRQRGWLVAVKGHSAAGFVAWLRKRED